MTTGQRALPLRRHQAVVCKNEPSGQIIPGSVERNTSSSLRGMARFQRSRNAGERQQATALELFFDLVFVFAITQVSHLLLGDLSWNGVGQALLVLLVVWWA